MKKFIAILFVSLSMFMMYSCTSTNNNEEQENGIIDSIGKQNSKLQFKILTIGHGMVGIPGGQIANPINYNGDKNHEGKNGAVYIFENPTENVWVYAVADSGYTFSHWEGDVGEEHHVLEWNMLRYFVLDSNVNVTAIFK